jgi:hypothetical protein
MFIPYFFLFENTSIYTLKSFFVTDSQFSRTITLKNQLSALIAN